MFKTLEKIATDRPISFDIVHVFKLLQLMNEKDH